MYYISDNMNLTRMDKKIRKSLDRFSIFNHSVIKDGEKVSISSRSPPKRSKTSMMSKAIEQSPLAEPVTPQEPNWIKN